MCLDVLSNKGSEDIREGGNGRGGREWGALIRERESEIQPTYIVCTSVSSATLSRAYCRSERAGRNQYWEWVESVSMATPSIPINRKWAGLSGEVLVAFPSSFSTCSEWKNTHIRETEAFESAVLKKQFLHNPIDGANIHTCWKNKLHMRLKRRVTSLQKR